MCREQLVRNRSTHCECSELFCRDFFSRHAPKLGPRLLLIVDFFDDERERAKGCLSSLEVLSVGGSHTGRLFETMTRHLYAWHGRGSGPSYYPAAVEIAALVAETPLDDPVADQYALIQELQPVDNVMDGHWLLERAFVRRRKGGVL